MLFLKALWLVATLFGVLYRMLYYWLGSFSSIILRSLGSVLMRLLLSLFDLQTQGGGSSMLTYLSMFFLIAISFCRFFTPYIFGYMVVSEGFLFAILRILSRFGRISPYSEDWGSSYLFKSRLAYTIFRSSFIFLQILSISYFGRIAFNFSSS